MDHERIAAVFKAYRDYLDNLHGVEIRAICTDTDFLLVQVGWTRYGHHEYSLIAHYILRDERLWVEYDVTQYLVADLRQAGISDAVIVYGVAPASRALFAPYEPQ